MCAFFFSSRRRHTRLVSDWSSDVCSSDLAPELVVAVLEQRLESGEALALEQRRVGLQKSFEHQLVLEQAAAAAPAQTVHLDVSHVWEIRGQIGRASCRERV